MPGPSEDIYTLGLATSCSDSFLWTRQMLMHEKLWVIPILNRRCVNVVCPLGNPDRNITRIPIVCKNNRTVKTRTIMSNLLFRGFHNTGCVLYRIYSKYTDIQTWKKCRPRPDATERASNLGLACLPLTKKCLDKSAGIRIDKFKFLDKFDKDTCVWTRVYTVWRTVKLLFMQNSGPIWMLKALRRRRPSCGKCRGHVINYMCKCNNCVT